MESSDKEELKHGGPKANCRFYRKQFPKINELVKVQVLSVDEVGAKVSLLEYNYIEGLIRLGELSNKRIQLVSDLIRVGHEEVMVVIRVYESEGYVDLSKKQVTADDIEKCEKKYQKGKAVNNILRHVAKNTSTDIKILYKTIVWPLCKIYQHALDAFRMAFLEPDRVFEELKITPDVRASLESGIN